ncbi:tetratricopeptide repeat protein [Blastopirellula marina]|nr:tetratricopeptide repeat protein [Blastopirellula marina]
MATCARLAENWLKHHPDDVPVMLDYAEVLVAMARYDESLRLYQRILELEPEKSGWIYGFLGHLYKEKGDFSEAEYWYQRAFLSAADDDASAFIFLGAVQARQGKLDEAEATHRRATLCSEGHIDEAFHNLGLVLRAQGRLEEAAECFRKAIEIDPDYDEWIEALHDVETALNLPLDDLV